MLSATSRIRGGRAVAKTVTASAPVRGRNPTGPASPSRCLRRTYPPPRAHLERHDVLDDDAGRRDGETSLRSYAAGAASFVFKSIDSSGLRKVLIGFIARGSRAAGRWSCPPPTRPHGSWFARTLRSHRPSLGIELDGVVHARPNAAGRFKSQTDLHSLDRLNGHHRLSQSAVQFLVPLSVGSQAEGQAFHTDLHHSTQRVTGLAGFVDRLP